jgi:protein ImuB
VPAQLAFDLEPTPGERRVACVILPELACELARWAMTKPAAQPALPRTLAQPRQGKPPEADALQQRSRPLGVVLMDGVDRKTTLGELNRSLEPNFRLSAVDAVARRLGIVEGQTIVEARCLHAALEIIALPRSKLAETLAKLAESLLDRAAVVAVEAPDTIWLEIGPVMRALGGETAIAKEVIERVRCLGHAVRFAVASGPRLAQLFARWAARGEPDGLFVPKARSLEVARALPLLALPLKREQLGWLGRLGLMKLGDLERLPAGELVNRLGRDSAGFIALARGEDDEPLFPIQPERVLREQLEWEEPVEGLERLRFVLRRLTSNLEARLAARGEAAERLSVTLQHDRGIARHRGVPFETHLHFDLARPLWYAEDLERIILARCERTQLLAPSIALELKVIAPTPKTPKQLELRRLVAGYGASAPAEEGLPVLLAELEVDIGIERVGLLRLADSHRPESKSLFVPCRLDDSRGRRRAKPRKAIERNPHASSCPTQQPANSNAQRHSPSHSQTLEGLTRLLERPIPLDPPIRVGATLFLEHQAYVIERLRFEERLEGLEWWNHSPISRDYWRLFLQGATGGLEVLIYVEVPNGRCFLQAVVD